MLSLESYSFTPFFCIPCRDLHFQCRMWLSLHQVWNTTFSAFPSWRGGMAFSVGEELPVCIKVKSVFFVDFEVKISPCSTVKELNRQIKAQSGLSNLLVKKYSPREYLASNLTLPEAGLLDNPTVFAFWRSQASALQQAMRRIAKGITQSSRRQTLLLQKMLLLRLVFRNRFWMDSGSFSLCWHVKILILTVLVFPMTSCLSKRFMLCSTVSRWGLALGIFAFGSCLIF